MPLPVVDLAGVSLLFSIAAALMVVVAVWHAGRASDTWTGQNAPQVALRLLHAMVLALVAVALAILAIATR